MANPTTNFGWQMPTSTDLVTDLPADFEVFGQAVDTTLVDLKGGTTGQVLSKASNTDMDFTWTNGGDITAVTAGTGISGGGTSGDVTITNSMATAIDAKGDLIVGTGADTFSRLAVGTNGQSLIADSAEATGLKWGSPSAPAVKGVSLTISTGITIANDTFQIITWDTENFDTDGYHSTSTNTDRITIPSGLGGKYLIICNMGIGSSSAGVRENRFYINGSLDSQFYGSTPYSARPYGHRWTAVKNLVAGDYITVAAYQTSGGNLSLSSGIGEGTNFTAIYLGA